MSEKLIDLSSPDFAERLASKDAVPGGGGAAALCGALGAALGAMAARLSEPGQEADMAALIERFDALRVRLLSLVDEDAEGFKPLAAAYAIPREEPGRAETLCRATLKALEAPTEMLRRAHESVEALEALLPRCRKLLLSDAGCAAALAGASLRCAAMNIFVNTRTLPQEQKEPREREAEEILRDGEKRAGAVYAAVEARLRES